MLPGSEFAVQVRTGLIADGRQNRRSVAEKGLIGGLLVDGGLMRRGFFHVLLHDVFVHEILRDVTVKAGPR